MIKALSPYWLYIPFVSPTTGLTCTNFTLQLFIWNGDKSTPPITPAFETTKSNPTGSTGSSRLNIANLVSDFVDFTQQQGVTTELINGNNQNWVKWQTFYTTTDPSDAATPTNQNVELMLKGYSYGMEGENKSTPSDKILLSGTEFKVGRDSVFVLPIKIDEAIPPPPSIVITSIVNSGTDLYNIFSDILGSYTGCTIYVDQVGSPFDLILNIDDFTSPLEVGIITPVSSTTYNVYIQAFDNATSTLVTSNTYVLILP